MDLVAGPLAMVFEPENAFLRTIRLGDHEILRGIYTAVRDRNWGTVIPVVSQLEIRKAAGSFHLSFDVECRQDEIDFAWRGEVTGSGEGSIVYRMSGEARSTFLRNRIGFCVLHPMICAGARCVVESMSGDRITGRFPDEISPDAPFRDMRSIRHEVSPALWAMVRFEGDAFEMEDQRNWTDASFKTFCTPLRLPYPVEIPIGTRIEQSVTLALDGELPQTFRIGRPTAKTRHGPERMETRIGETPLRLARIGVGCASHGGILSPRERDRLRTLNLSHLRVDLHLGETGWREEWNSAVGDAFAIGARLETAVFVTDRAGEELRELAGAAGRNAPVMRWLVFHEKEKSTARRWIETARAALSGVAAGARFGAGSNAYFTEINRERPPVDLIDLVAYSINPQVHAFDDVSLVESLETQAETVRSARGFAPGRGIAVTPVTLRPRFNPDATGVEPPPKPGELPWPVDPRQRSLFAAGWTLGSIRYLSEGGADSVTYYETTGWRGVMETETGSPLPDRFPSKPGEVFPLYHVLADVGEMAGGEMRAIVTGDPTVVSGLALSREGRRRILLANHAPSVRRLRLAMEDIAADFRNGSKMRSLDESSLRRATVDPEGWRLESGESRRTEDGAIELELPPHACIHIDNII